MNKTRRKAIEKILERLEDINAEIEEISGEQEEYLDNVPDNLRGGSKFEIAENASYALLDAVSSMTDVISNLEKAIEE